MNSVLIIFIHVYICTFIVQISVGVFCVYKAVDKKMSWNENYQALVLEKQYCNCTRHLLALAGSEQFGVEQGSEYNESHSEAVVFLEMSGCTFFPRVQKL